MVNGRELEVQISDLWTDWGELLEAAREYKLLPYVPAEVSTMGVTLRKCVPSMDSKLLEMG